VEYRAKQRYADVTARKIRRFADLIRGRNVDEAIELLRFYPNRGARLLEAVVKSALGNATHDEYPNLEDLIVSEARVDGGPMFKRMRPRARGTAFMIQKKLSHIVIALKDPNAVEAPAVTTPTLTTTEGTVPVV